MKSKPKPNIQVVDDCNASLPVKNYSNIYAFGDSLTDTGNLFYATTVPDNIRFTDWHNIPPTPFSPPYFEGRSTVYISAMARKCSGLKTVDINRMVFN